MGDVRAVEAKTEVLLIKKVGTPQKKLSPFIYFGLLPFLLLIVAMLFAGLADGTVNAATDSPEIRVGSELEFPPYAFVDKNGQPAGFSVDLIKAVAAVMGLPIKISTGPWDNVWKELVAGRLDVLPIVAKSPERRHLVEFSLAHTETYDAFFVRKGDPQIQNVEAARGKEIVVMRSDAAHHALLERNFQGRLILVETIPVGLSLIASGKHDAFLCSKLIGTMVIQEHGLKNLAAGPLIPDYKRVFSFAVKKGDTELLEKLNQGLLIIKTTHEYDRIYEKWLTADDPWWKFKKYLWPAIVIVTAIALIAGCWLVILQRLVKKRTRQLSESNEMLRLAQERLEERVAQRTVELTRANVALQSEIAERQRAEIALRESEDRFRKIFENAATGIAIMDWEGRFQQCNPAYCTLLGFTEEELRRSEFPSLIHPEDRDANLAEIRRLQAGELPFFQIENRYVRKDGQQVWVQKFVSVLPDATGKPTHLVALVTDVTERKAAEQALRESRKDLNRAQGVAHTGSWRMNVQKNELTWSNENHRIFGIPPGTPMTYETFLGTVHPEDREYVDRKWTAALQGEPYDIEHRLIVDGKVKWVRERAELEFDAEGRLLGGFGTTQDITGRKKIEEALKEAHARTAAILNSISDSFFALDSNMVVTYYNRTAEKVLGRKAKEVLGKKVFDAFPEARGSIFEEKYTEALRTGRAVTFEAYFDIPPFENWYDVRAYPFGQGLSVYFQVTTERKRAEEALKRSHAELEQRVAERTADLRHTVEQLQWEIAERQQAEQFLRESEERLRFLASQLLTTQEMERKRLALELHDDLGQSLMVLKMQLGAVERMLPAKQSKAKDGLGHSLDHLKEMVENVRRMCHDLLPPVLKDLGLKVAIEQLLTRFGEHAEINLSWDLDELGGMFSPEAEISIYRIMQESLTNIAKHAQATQIKVAVKRQDGNMAFRVEDNGKGFNLLEIQCGDYSKEGLGLIAMDERVRLLGGELHISSEPGTGTKLSFIVPTNL